MTEKLLTNKKHGMAMLLCSLPLLLRRLPPLSWAQISISLVCWFSVLLS